MIAKNFKFLYKYYGDKQEVLAKMFDVPQSNISAYVNGKKQIPTNILNSISVRYGVSSDDLMNKDLSVEYDSPQIVDLDDVANFGENMLPILTSKVAKNNDNFNRAYNMYHSALELDNIEDFYGKISILEYVISLYQKAWEESNTYVALSNSISTILLIFSFYNQKGIEFAQALLNSKKPNLLDIKSGILLRDPNHPIKHNIYEKQQKLFFEKYEELVYNNIKLLKSNMYFSELGDYYLAICYWLGFDEDLSEYEVCTQTGIYMLFQLCKIGNKYAERFIDSFPFIS